MLTVGIFINGGLIVGKNAIRQSTREDGKVIYMIDSGETIIHDPKDGAVVLAKKLLDTIRNETE